MVGGESRLVCASRLTDGGVSNVGWELFDGADLAPTSVTSIVHSSLYGNKKKEEAIFFLTEAEVGVCFLFFDGAMEVAHLPLLHKTSGRQWGLLANLFHTHTLSQGF